MHWALVAPAKNRAGTQKIQLLQPNIAKKALTYAQKCQFCSVQVHKCPALAKVVLTIAELKSAGVLALGGARADSNEIHWMSRWISLFC